MNRYARFLRRLEEYSELECLVTGGTTYSYADLVAECRTWRQRLAEAGTAPGTVVGLRTDYSLSSIAALLTLLGDRVIVALIPREGDASTYLHDACAPTLLEIREDGAVDWRPQGPAPDHALLRELRRRGDGGIVIFTSGSSGRPKAAVQAVERFMHKFIRPGRRYRTLAFLLFDHIAGLDTLFYTLSSGGTIVTTRSRDPNAVCELVERTRVEVLPASPSFLRLLRFAGGARDNDLRSLKIITYGSEPMDASTLAWVNERFPEAQIIQKYGTTETGSPRSKSRGNDSLWMKIKDSGVTTRVIDGVLHIRSEGTILGYLNAPSPITADGWYCTGDFVEVETDENGEWMRFRGRVSDTINVGGEKVSPAEVEGTILELPFVTDAVVRGEPHAMLGQIVTARVALTSPPDAKQAISEIRKRCRARLAPYKVPVKIDVVKAGELTSQRQKASRREFG